MTRVRMYHPASDSYQYASDSAFDRTYQHEGWVLAPEDEDPAPAAVEPVPVAAEGESADPPAEASDAEPPKRGRSK